MKHVGAHISAAGGLYNAFLNAQEINARAFALFIKPRTWKYNPLTDKVIEDFKAHLEESDVKADYILPHGQYIVNLGSTDEELIAKSYDFFLDDLQRCELLGLKLYNLHPGSAGAKGSREECIKSIAKHINKALHATKSVTVVLENMAG